MLSQSRSSESGQILILVMLVLLVGLTVGLSLAARSISNIQNSGDLDQSNRAFSAAEAGIEHALVNCPTAGTCASSPLVSGVDSQKVTVSNVGGTQNIGYEIDNLAQDDVAQATMTGYTGALPTLLDLYWGNKTGSEPAIVVSILKFNGTTYSLTKLAFDAQAASHLNNFTAPLPSPQFNCTNSTPIQTQLSASETLKCHTQIGIDNQTVLLRVRFMYYGGQPIAFMPAVGKALPSQGKLYTSTATVNGKQRTVTAFQSNAQLPAIFDYAIFNGSTSPLSK